MSREEGLFIVVESNSVAVGKTLVELAQLGVESGDLRVPASTNGQRFFGLKGIKVSVSAGSHRVGYETKLTIF